jgi:hypothetical protein
MPAIRLKLHPAKKNYAIHGISEQVRFQIMVDSRATRKSDTPRGAGGLVSGAASKAVVPLVEASR